MKASASVQQNRLQITLISSKHCLPSVANASPAPSASLIASKMAVRLSLIELVFVTSEDVANLEIFVGLGFIGLGKSSRTVTFKYFLLVSPFDVMLHFQVPLDK